MQRKLANAFGKRKCYNAAMPYMHQLAEFAPISGRGRMLGLDLGSKTIGLALSDTARGIATPFKTLVRGKFGDNASELAALVATHEVSALVCGLPLNMDGSSGARAQATRAFARNLSKHPDFADVPLLLWDERLSTAAVERTLITADVSRAKRAAVIDKMAAAYILQGALDALKK